MIKGIFATNKRLIATISAILVVGVVLTLIFVLTPIFSKKDFEIYSVQIKLNGKVVEQIEREYRSDDIQLEVVINNGENLSGYNNPKIEWGFDGESFGASIANGILSLQDNDTLGRSIVCVTVSSSNTMTATTQLSILPKDDWTLEGVIVDNSEFDVVEGQPVNKEDFVVLADFGDMQIYTKTFDIDKQEYSLLDKQVQISYQHKQNRLTTIVPIAVEQKALQYLEIAKQPNVTHYVVGQTFDTTGMKIVAHFEYMQQEITEYYFDNSTLSENDSSIVLSYSQIHSKYGLITKNIEQPIVVGKKVLQSISVDSTDVKLHYVQGQRFDKTNLQVMANYQYLSNQVQDYIVDTTTKLLYGTKNIVVSYTNDGVTKTHTLNIVVDKPYTNFRTIKVLDFPNEMRLDWVYYYMTDDGVDKIDNTAYSENELIFDTLNGVYQVPVGAIVTITAINPAIVDFAIDGQSVGLQYPAKAHSFEVKNDEEQQEIKISCRRINDRTTVSFVSDNGSVILSYPRLWVGVLYERDLQQLSLVFGENDEYYCNLYLVDEREYTLVGLGELVFDSNKDTKVAVIKKERTQGTPITLVYWDGFEVVITVDKTVSNWQDSLPILTRTGYIFVGWDFQDETAVAQWTRDNPNYSGRYIGSWQYQGVVGGKKIECQIVLNADGTYEYKTTIDGVLNLLVTGFYEYDTLSSVINIMSVESDTDLMLVTTQDFAIKLDNILQDKITLNVLVVNEYNLVQLEANFEKANA